MSQAVLGYPHKSQVGSPIMVSYLLDCLLLFSKVRWPNENYGELIDSGLFLFLSFSFHQKKHESYNFCVHFFLSLEDLNGDLF